MSLIDQHVALGYQRIKLKIKPGWDVDIVRRGPSAAFGACCRSTRTRPIRSADRDHLRRLDDFNLLMIEQPLEYDDLIDHARLQAGAADRYLPGREHHRRGSAPRRRSIWGACRLINIKIGRVGGYSQALAIHDVCQARQAPVWCGGMLESGIGRAHNLALASLPNFTLPGDISASSRYFTARPGDAAGDAERWRQRRSADRAWPGHPDRPGLPDAPDVHRRIGTNAACHDRDDAGDEAMTPRSEIEARFAEAQPRLNAHRRQLVQAILESPGETFFPLVAPARAALSGRSRRRSSAPSRRSATSASPISPRNCASISCRG